MNSLDHSLSELMPIVGMWAISGGFSDDPEKRVEGWERYTIVDGGRELLCETEIFTIKGLERDVYKNSMKIFYDKEKGKIMGEPDWEFSAKARQLVVENKGMRLISTFNEQETILSGKWETRDRSGTWRYWYDKILTKMV